MKRCAYFFAIGFALFSGSASLLCAQEKGGILNVATVGEPPTLDPMTSTADLVGTVSQHIFETLYTFDKNWKPIPLVAQSLPAMSNEGKTYTITLRQGLTFHNGDPLTASDVTASLNRWMKVATRGKQAAENILRVETKDAKTIDIHLKTPYAPLLSLLAFNNSAAVIMPAKLLAGEGALAPTIGSGPYMLKERKPDQYIQLVRFPAYKSPEGNPDAFGGARRQYVDEIRFIPIPDPATRVEGAIAGQFDYIDALPVESFERVKNATKSSPVLIKPFGYPVFVMNTKSGLMQDLNHRLAVRTILGEADMLAAAFGDKQFFNVNAAFYPEGYAYHTQAGTKDAYNVSDPDKAMGYLKQTKYAGEALRILTSRQYEFHYKMATVAAEYLRSIGYRVDVQVVDWATLTQRRTNPTLWDIYITHSPFLPEPSLMGFMSSSSPGWWESGKSRKLIDEFNRITDPQQRVAKWAEVQTLIYREVPVIKIGDFHNLAAQSRRMEGYVASPWPYFWNVSLKKP